MEYESVQLVQRNGIGKWEDHQITMRKFQFQETISGQNWASKKRGLEVVQYSDVSICEHGHNEVTMRSLLVAKNTIHQLILSPTEYTQKTAPPFSPAQVCKKLGG